MAKAKGDDRTGDLFDVERVWPVRAPQSLPKALDMKRQISMSMMEAVRESGKTVPVIAAEMTDLLGDDEVTPQQLYAYTAPSKTTHNISLVRFIAFVRATGCLWLWDVCLQDEGLLLLQGEEARHAQASLAEAHARRLMADAKRIRSQAPLEVRIPRGRK